MALDWLTKAAREIAASPHYLDEEDVRAILVAHVPFQLDALYMPVPRCEGCASFYQAVHLHHDANEGYCDTIVAHVTRDFGCVKWEAKP